MFLFIETSRLQTQAPAWETAELRLFVPPWFGQLISGMLFYSPTCFSKSQPSPTPSQCRCVVTACPAWFLWLSAALPSQTPAPLPDDLSTLPAPYPIFISPEQLPLSPLYSLIDSGFCSWNSNQAIFYYDVVVEVGFVAILLLPFIVTLSLQLPWPVKPHPRARTGDGASAVVWPRVMRDRPRHWRSSAKNIATHINRISIKKVGNIFPNLSTF